MGPYSLADLVDDELRVMDALGLDTVSFVGFSIGALIGQALALAHPDRLEALVLLSGVGARTPAEQRRAIERLGVVRSSDPADVARDSVERWFTPRFGARYPRLVEDEIAIVSRTSPLGYAACYEVLATSDLIDELNEIVTPTLVVTGENDVGSTPRMSAEIHQRISASRLIVLPGLRHYIHLEGSGIVADLITGFLDEVAANQIGG
jgi:pimeloyl-ACP methyl ester carboxylesterase